MLEIGKRSILYYLDLGRMFFTKVVVSPEQCLVRYLRHLLNKCSDKVRQSFNLELGSFLSTSQNFKLYSIPRVVNTLGMSSRNLDKEISFNLPA